MYRSLQYTILMLVMSLIYFQFYSNKNIIEKILAILLVAVIISSQFFWQNPIQNTFTHKIDAVIARICIFSFIIYTIIFKIQSIEMAFVYAMLLGFICLSAWNSNNYSRISWCSLDHIQSHVFLHYYCFIATFFAFM
jgi:hypothetical protein